MRRLFMFLFIILIIIFCFFSLNKRKEKTDFLNNEVLSEVILSMKVVINNKEYNAYLENNETTRELIKDDFNYTMKELNGNEKYIYLDYDLPSNPINIQKIEKGDIMLFGDNCIVIFYKSFDTTYSYTKIGHIDVLDEIDNSDIDVQFIY